MLKILNFEVLMLFLCDIILCLGTEKNPGFIYKLQSYWVFFFQKMKVVIVMKSCFSMILVSQNFIFYVNESHTHKLNFQYLSKWCTG